LHPSVDIYTNQSFGFGEVDFTAAFGDLDLPTGILAVKQPTGVYDFKFNSNVSMTTSSYARLFQLRINGNLVKEYNLNQVYPTNGTVHQPVALSASL